MAFTKRLLKHPRTQIAACWLLTQYIRLVYLTSRKTRIYHEAAKPFLSGEQNALFAFWHGRMMMCPLIEPPGRKMHVLISHHRDGLLISRVIGHFGEATIAGSSSRGGSNAIKAILRALKAGDNVAITPDGPRGPAQVAQIGIAATARISGRPVLPVAFAASRCVRLKSWDRFMLALPFSRIVFCVGEPIGVSKEAGENVEEIARQAIEERMNHLQDKADALASGAAQHG
ncbi:MAG: lysophospholipid acyltransferase family protein [Rickettsiales bacterium]|nr:lysophospholipid acyltransferase family protein [Rickettsiales bacterium]